MMVVRLRRKGRAGFHPWLLFSAADSGLPVVQLKDEL